MPVALRYSPDSSPWPTHQFWFAAGPIANPPNSKQRLPNLARRLESAFDAIRDEWWALGRAMAAEPGGDLSHAASCATSPSDFGTMLAWSRLVAEVAAEAPTVVVLCDDPWLFRHLTRLDGVEAGYSPPLWPAEVGLRMRGIAARLKVAVTMAFTSLRLRHQRRNHVAGRSCLLVYGHPRSDADGHDAYFGPLLKDMPALGRLLHTDCSTDRAAALGADGRSAALHAWGNPLFALTLFAVRWRPGRGALQGPNDWLVHRAAALEGSGGAHAMTRWQMHCQHRWLAKVRPSAVVWPWENHPWERDFVRAARVQGARTAGYLHTVVGPHMYNQSPHPNPDGLESIPDLILCNGPGYKADLERLGMPADRLEIGGAFRFQAPLPAASDPEGPIFAALSSNLAAARQMLDAVRAVARHRRQFVVKAHPMYPIDIPENESVRVTDRPLDEQQGLSGVLYCASVVGLEAALAGLPTIRFLTDGGVAMNVLPAAVDLPTADAASLDDAIANLSPPPAIEWGSIFADVDMDRWRRFLAGGSDPS